MTAYLSNPRQPRVGIGNLIPWVPIVQAASRVLSGAPVQGAVQSLGFSQSNPVSPTSQPRAADTGQNYSPYTPQNYSPYNPAPQRQPTGGGGGQVLGSNTGLFNQAENNVNQTQGENLGLVDQEFEDALNMFAGQEQALQSQAGVSTGAVRGEETSQLNTLTGLRDTSEGTVAGQETQARKTEAGGLRDARDLFRQIQQQNIITTSGAGISSSSVTEALAERLGVETARRIAGITGSTQEVLNNLNRERLRIQQVFTQKVDEVKTNVTNQIAQIQQNLLQGINQINANRAQAATQKAQQRAGILQWARDSILTIQTQARDYQLSLEAAARRRAEALDNARPLFEPDIAGTGAQQLSQGVQGDVNALTALSPNFNWAPQTTMQNGQPYVTGYSPTQRRPEEEEELTF